MLKSIKDTSVFNNLSITPSIPSLMAQIPFQS